MFPRKYLKNFFLKKNGVPKALRQRFFEKKSSFSEDIEKVGGLITAREKTIYNLRI